MASIPPKPTLPDLPDAIKQLLKGPLLDPVQDPGPTMSPIDPADVRPVPESESDLPAPPDDAPTQDDLNELREKQSTPVQDDTIEIVDRDQVSPSAGADRSDDPSVDVASDDNEHDTDHENDGGDHADHDGGSEG